MVVHPILVGKSAEVPKKDLEVYGYCSLKYQCWWNSGMNRKKDRHFQWKKIKLISFYPEMDK